MPRDLKVRVTLPYRSGFATDVAINTFSFHDPGGGTLSDLADAVRDFYNVVPSVGPAPASVSSYLASTVSRQVDSARIDIYDRAAPPNSDPEYTQLWEPDAPAGGSDLPAEVAVVLSFQRTGGVTPTERRRWRGRVFIGPLRNHAFLTDPASGLVYVDGSFQSNLLNSAAEQLGADALTDGFIWQVWSEADNDGETINEVFINNAPDTMRSRGPRATSRQSIPV